MIRRASQQDVDVVTELMLGLWPDSADMREECAALLADESAAVLLAEEGGPVGFAQCQLRHDYVEGTHGGPVGYLEGIYVRPEARGRGLARALLAHAEAWAREKGCREFASDCELTNTDSLSFHLKTGFKEAGRIICFVKRLQD